MSERTSSRRTVLGGLAGAAGVTVSLPLLSACGSGGGSANAMGTEGAGGAPAPTGPIAETSDIRVGGGKIFPAEKVVLTQPTAGDFKAFSAVCTHQGCLVATIAGDEINCPCHGSRFSIKDGSVLDGPAPKPLPELPVKVTGQELSVG